MTDTLRNKVTRRIKKSLLGPPPPPPPKPIAPPNIPKRQPQPPPLNYDVIRLDSLNVARLLYFDHLVQLTRDVPGNILECGVGAGNSVLMLGHILHIRGIPKFLWGFDSFEGFPDPSPEDASFRNVQKGEVAHKKQRVLETLRQHLNNELFFRAKISLIKGYFQDTLQVYKGPISLLNLDVDLYESYKVCLDTLYPLVSPGGIIAFDEYHREGDVFPGAPKAIDEFFADKDMLFVKDALYGKFYAIKEPNVVQMAAAAKDELGST